LIRLFLAGATLSASTFLIKFSYRALVTKSSIALLCILFCFKTKSSSRLFWSWYFSHC